MHFTVLCSRIQYEMCIKKVRAMMIFAAHFQSLCNIFLPNMKSKTKQIYRVNSESFSVCCCGATEGSEQQHNQDLKEIFKGRRILEFITFYHNALHLTRVHCATNNSNKNTWKVGGGVHRSLLRLRVFFAANFLQHG